MRMKPTIAARQPVVLDLEAGTYWWCRCGRSKKQPFCDGAHKGTEFAPMEFKLEAKKTIALCLCKQTAAPPFCDGAHSNLP
jgi:CDGSH-type Zn-finger protein